MNTSVRWNIATGMLVGLSLLARWLPPAQADSDATPAESKVGVGEAPPLAGVDQVLEWLPADTETVLVARGPFQLKAQEPKQEFGAATLEEALRELAFGFLRSTPESRKELADQTVVLAVEGSRHFRSPSNLGMMPYEGSTVLVFKNDLGPTVPALMKALRKAGAKRLDISGHQGIVLNKKEEEDTWTYLVVQPKANVIVCATDRKYLEEVLERMRKPAAKRALPADLPEWKQVDVKAPFWAVRHYDKAQAATDPSSPLAGKKRAANVPDSQAVGLTFSYAPGPGQLARVRYLSSNEIAVQIVKLGWSLPHEGLEPTIKPLFKGVVEITFEPKIPRACGVFLLVLLGAWGHGIYL